MIGSIDAISGCFRGLRKHPKIQRSGDLVQIDWTDKPLELAERAGRIVTSVLESKPDAAIALPTGNTPLGLYRHLVELQQAGRLSCDRARFFNLDEFIGKSTDDPSSYGAFLWQHLLRPLAIKPRQVRLLRGDALDLEAECRDFEQAIAAAGGLDLAVLGLGANGHVAFNEPGSDWDSMTREVVLADTTRQAQHRLFDTHAHIPRSGLTMGLRTIRKARAILLLVSGSSKANALAALLRGIPDENWPVTALLDHSNLAIVADRKLNPNAAMATPRSVQSNPATTLTRQTNRAKHT
jgi:glucosamine-6-phosphate deaminase